MKTKLLDAALIHFSEVGYHGVSVPQIAKTAGVATGSLYNHFQSKDDLINELYFYWKFKLKESYLVGYPIDLSARAQFDFIWNRLHEFAEQFTKAFQFIEYHMHGSYLRSECLELEEEIFEIGRTFVRSAQQQGSIRQGPAQVLVSYFFGAFVQYFKDCIADRAKWSSENSKLIRDFCWDGMTPFRQ